MQGARSPRLRDSATVLAVPGLCAASAQVGIYPGRLETVGSRNRAASPWPPTNRESAPLPAGRGPGGGSAGEDRTLGPCYSGWIDPSQGLAREVQRRPAIKMRENRAAFLIPPWGQQPSRIGGPSTGLSLISTNAGFARRLNLSRAPKTLLVAGFTEWNCGQTMHLACVVGPVVVREPCLHGNSQLGQVNRMPAGIPIAADVRPGLVHGFSGDLASRSSIRLSNSWDRYSNLPIVFSATGDPERSPARRFLASRFISRHESSPV